MKIKESFYMKVAVLKLYGKLMGPPDTDELLSELKSLLEEGFKRIVIDLKHVRWINSVGMGALIKCYNIVRSNEGSFFLADLSPKTRSVMFISQMHRVFQIKETVKEAVKFLNQKG